MSPRMRKLRQDRSANETVAVAVGVEKRMFSAASFFDVIDSISDLPRQPLNEPTEVPDRPATVAFYGFRGGAGRTLALAHVAIMLAQRGLRVGAIDLDIEAPGLHVALGASAPKADKGLVPLLYKTLTNTSTDDLAISEHLQVIEPKEGTGKVLLLPAGQVSRKYLAQIEELGVALWHETTHSPLERILIAFRKETLDVLFIDCRTGFSGLSASVLFHLSDLVVVFFPLTEQVWDGVDVLLQAVAAARVQRRNKPALLFVPSMVPPGDAGTDKLQRYILKLGGVYRNRLNTTTVPTSEEEEQDAEDEDEQPWLEQGLPWDPRISADGAARQPFRPGGAWGLFQPLSDSIVAALDLVADHMVTDTIPVKGILEELQIKGSDGFAEELDEQQMQWIMVPSESVRAALDRTSALVIGAKGSGKTLLWRFLVENKGNDIVRITTDTRYLVGHAPKQELDPQGLTLSADSFKEMEHDARMKEGGTYKAFWLLYGVFRLCRVNAEISDWVDANIPQLLKSAWRALAASEGMPDFVPLLNSSRISTQIEDLLADLDRWLATKEHHYVLVYDGLDSGFQTGKPETWYTRRERFVTGMLQVVSDWRNRLRRLQFKVFLREDIYLSIDLQNRSHLDAAKHELRFGPTDLWQLALKLATTSPTYRSTIAYAKTGTDGLYVGDEGELKSLLFPLWGRTVEKGKKAYTANYILKRTSDAQGRLFPRTFIQMLDAAIKFEKRSGVRTESDRVLRFRALQEGVSVASKQRVDDLRTEYVELKPYLEALRGAPAVAPTDKLIAKMKPNIGRPALSLHLGAGGWRKVIDRLITVGVMGRKSGDDSEEEKLSVALLYRVGLGVKAAGLR